MKQDTLLYKKIPSYDIIFSLKKTASFCLVIPVINEGLRIISLLKRIYDLQRHNLEHIDIIIIDGGSNDGSLEKSRLLSLGVSALLLKTGPGQLSAQLRCAYDYALNAGYEGIITIDGNDKDDPSPIYNMINELRNGVDFVQASRFLPGGKEINTPLLRKFAIRCIHAPILSFASGFKWTDTTQGFRAYSRRIFLDSNINIFRDIFNKYELLVYLSYIVPKLGYVCKEIPSKRIYPHGTTPTKISLIKGNFDILKVLILTVFGFYNPIKHTR